MNKKANRNTVHKSWPMTSIVLAAGIVFSGFQVGNAWALSDQDELTSEKNGEYAHRVALRANEFAVSDIRGIEGEPAVMKITLPPNPTERYSFMMVVGLPSKFTLSAGFATKNQWAVSLNDVNGLRIIPPYGYSGSFKLEVLLVKGKDIAPERRTINVQFFASQTPEPETATPAPITEVPSQVLTSNRQDTDADVLSTRAPAKALPDPRTMDDEERLMIERGDLLFRQGDVASARLIYHRLAKKGLAPAALAMARTYDPEVLKPLKVEGLRPDVAQARIWYKMAEELGSSQAKNRLTTLPKVDF